MNIDKDLLKICGCCLIEKPIEEYWSYKKKGATYFKSNCVDCEGKDRCHTCKTVKNKDRFYTNKKGLINKIKCKDCYKSDYKKYIRENPLFDFTT
jgi:hypothetical protein